MADRPSQRAPALVVSNSKPYPVALPDGRHLGVGEFGVELPDSPELRSLEDAGLINIDTGDTPRFFPPAPDPVQPVVQAPEEGS